MWFIVLPLDVAKTRLQTSGPGSAWDVGVLRHLRLLWQEGRLRALYSGLTPTLVRAFPANAFQWVAWELAMQQLSGPLGGVEGSLSGPAAGAAVAAARTAAARDGH
jgi:hypothetical protein